MRKKILQELDHRPRVLAELLRRLVPALIAAAQSFLLARTLATTDLSRLASAETAIHISSAEVEAEAMVEAKA
ncbi:hypothetical protein IYW40_03670 [Methylocystis sp. H4A]|uniref:hypothetical protein n=1 Tax=Methylocystis sp. H4A TaxID=2785788 RepID=UPI0018C2BB7B|nr:hypothetical protein [Methylocystis sp. H4A]MBG0800590.1 hypothetical protein [Methylocystis sp. H4A]